MKKPKKRYTVFTEDNIRNSNKELVKQAWLYYYGSDDKAMAISIAGSLVRIQHSYRVVDNVDGKVIWEWIREGFHAS